MTRFTSTTPLLLLALGACIGSPGTAPPEARMGLAFQTDASRQPSNDLAEADVTSVQLDVSSIEAHVDDEWMVLDDQPRMIELMVLEDGTSDELNDLLVRPGHYTQVRLIVADDSAIVIDGEAWPLRVSSGDQTGLKVPLDADVQEGHEYELRVAFDLDDNLVHDAHGWKLKPVLHVESFDVVPPQAPP